LAVKSIQPSALSIQSLYFALGPWKHSVADIGICEFLAQPTLTAEILWAAEMFLHVTSPPKRFLGYEDVQGLNAER
jgi:hypothetical protein